MTATSGTPPAQIAWVAHLFFAPNSHPMLSVPPTAPILSLPNPGRSVQVGQRLTFTCRSQGGSSVKSLCSIYQTPFRRKPRPAPCLPDQQPTSGGRDRERRRDSAHDRLEGASPGSSGGVIFGNLHRPSFQRSSAPPSTQCPGGRSTASST